MRLARLVAAGLVLGAVVGLVTALVRSRGYHPVPSPHEAPPGPRSTTPGSTTSTSATAGSTWNGSTQVRPAGAGADLPTRPLPLLTSPALAGTGGSR